MDYLDLDFTVPIALLGGAILAVVIVRQATLYGAKRARDRTKRLLAAYPVREPAAEMPDDEAEAGIDVDADAS